MKNFIELTRTLSGDSFVVAINCIATIEEIYSENQIHAKLKLVIGGEVSESPVRQSYRAVKQFIEDAQA